MEALEKYFDHVIEKKSVSLHTPAPPPPPPPLPESEGGPSPIAGVLRRWYIVVVVFLIICGAGLPAIWLLVEPLYSVTGAIRVDPILTSILSGETEDYGGTQVFNSFMNTQAAMVTSANVLERVADDVSGKNLSFFEEESNDLVRRLKRKLEGANAKPPIATILKEAILDEVIVAAADRQTQLIRVTMKSTKPQEAELIVNAFIRNYMAVEVSSSAQGEGQKLTVLENERKVLAEKLQSQRTAITQLAQEYGTAALDGRQNMMLQRVSSLLAELTRIEARRIGLEAQVQLLEQTKEQSAAPETLLKMRQDYINSDPTVTALTTNIAQLDQTYIAASQALTSTNPELERKAELLKALKARLEERKGEAGKTFDDMMTQEITKAGNQRLTNAKVELEQTKAYESRLREILTKEDSETIGLGRKQLTIQDLKDQQELTKQLYDTVSRRIQELEMERKRPARISIAYLADVSEIGDKRIKFSIAIIFGGAACGMILAFLRDKADRRLHTPEDVFRRIGIPILGTTTSSHAVKAALLPGQIVEDYQTIRANLGLLNDEGMPKKVVVTSPGMQEGKTTFAINLATSMAKSGKRVLLIDGDLRKPDIGYLLNLPRGSRGLQDVLMGRELDQVVWSAPSTGLDVLAADSRNASDAYELLASPLTAQRINMVSQRYDHVIIDAPPALAFPDALIWAKLADAVILTSFAGQTTAQDLKAAMERLKQINVRVLGTILSNVQAGRGYYRYGYSYYYSRNAHSKRSEKQAQARATMLMPTQSGEDNPNTTDSANTHKQQPPQNR
jgi:succinoglycan biosynthesis transport protein ExoP